MIFLFKHIQRNAPKTNKREQENFEKKIGLTKRTETNNEIKVKTLKLNRTETYFLYQKLEKKKETCEAKQINKTRDGHGKLRTTKQIKESDFYIGLQKK